MLENAKYSLGREFKFYATEKQGRDCGCGWEGDGIQETECSNNHPGGGFGRLPDGRGREDNMFFVFAPSIPGDGGGYERSPGAD